MLIQVMGKKYQRKKKQKVELEIVPKDEIQALPSQRMSNEVVPRKEKWTNKQRVLIFAARGISHRDRHLMKDIRSLMPHHRSESKMERSKNLSVVNEVCEIKHCNKSILFEGRRKRDLYMWLSNISVGPSIKFLVENVHTMAELKMTGNCLKGSRPLLSFDNKFDEIPYLKLIKELLTQTFSVPNYHPKSQPFIDHVYTFTYLDKRIWFRNFQILSEDGGLAEIGPRFVLNPIKVFEHSFTGNTLWENPDYVSPAKQRQMLKKAAKERYVNRVEQKVQHEANLPKNAYKGVSYDDIFENAKEIETAKRLIQNAMTTPSQVKTTFQRDSNSIQIGKKKMRQVKEVIEKKKRKTC